MAAISTIVAGTLAVGSVVEGRSARKEQQRARRIQQRAARIQTTRDAINQVRLAQVARAEVVAGAEATGTGSSSAALGGAGAIQSQAAGNIAFAQSMFTLQQAANRRMERSADASFRSAAFGTLSGVVGGMDLGTFGNEGD